MLRINETGWCSPGEENTQDRRSRLGASSRFYLWVAPAQNADRFTSIVRTMGRDCYCHVYHGYAGWLLVCDAELLDSPPQQRGQLRWDVHASLSLNGCELRTRE